MAPPLHVNAKQGCTNNWCPKDEEGVKIRRVKIAYAVKARTPYMIRGRGVQESLKKG